MPWQPTKLAVNPAGGVTQARSYEPYGKSLSTTGNPLTKYGFTSEWTDSTNLIYLRARHYDPATGRFTSKDPYIGMIALPITLDPYIYALNNPILYVDPAGMSAQEISAFPLLFIPIYRVVQQDKVNVMY